MKKKVLLFTSIGALFLVGVSTVAISGVNQLDRLQVKADPTEYSVTFTESNTTVEEVDGNYVICTTTAAGNKVGVVGLDSSDVRFTFNGASFFEFWLYGSEILAKVGANDFDHITGFAISFSGKPVGFIGGLDDEEVFIDVESGEKYDVSMTPDDLPGFMTNGEVIVTISSLTIWYSC